MSAAEIIAILAAVTALFVAIANGMKQRSDAILSTQRDKLTAKRDEFTLLSTAFDQLEERNQQLYTRVCDLESKLETERQKRRELEDVVMAKDARIAELEQKVGVLEAQLEELEQTPRTRKKSNGVTKA